MESEIECRNKQRVRRAFRVRKKVRGCAARPRLSVFRSNQHISAQVIDDENGITLVSAGTYALKTKGCTKSIARQVGAKLAELAKEKQIAAVVFDRGSYRFHGVVAELAAAAREGGLQF